MKEEVRIDRRELVALLFKLDTFGDKLITEGREYKRLTEQIRQEYLFKTRKEIKQ